MKVPKFSDNNRRSLSTETGSKKPKPLKMAELNVQKIVDISFDLRSDIPKSALKYSLEITQWTERGVEIYMNFSNPEAVS